MRTLLAICAFAVAYTWLCYPGLLLALRLLRRRQFLTGEPLADVPLGVSVVLTVRNEERLIESRLDNLLATTLAPGALEVVVASDGSDDATNEIVQRMAAKDGRIRLLALDGQGKSAAQQHAIAGVRREIVVLTDAEATFAAETIANLLRPFADAKVGCSSGRVILRDEASGVATSQGMYWRYEMWLRALESSAGVMHTASGQVMAFRKTLFRPFDSAFGDDCVIPLDIVRRGSRVVHVEDAVAFDTFPSSAAGELRARTRMTLRNFACTIDRLCTPELLRRPVVTVAIVSHKLMRWFTPFFLIGALAANCCLVRAGRMFDILLLLQAVFYALGAVGYVADRVGRKVPVASQLFSFLLANLGFMLGVISAVRGHRITAYHNRRSANA